MSNGTSILKLQREEVKENAHTMIDRTVEDHTESSGILPGRPPPLK